MASPTYGDDRRLAQGRERLTFHDVAAEIRRRSLGAGGVCPASRRLSLRVIGPSEEARAEVYVELLAVTQAGNPVGRCYACCDTSLFRKS
jgi:hypothetical protein